MYDYLDDRQTKRLKELVPYEVLAPDADEIIKDLERLNNITKNQDRKIKLAIKIFENINKKYGESSSINDVIGVLKEDK